ncbi:MAG: 4-hydroxybutyrate--acetyl-CoA CoA transferase [Firmicutes bacterium]|nr:4-hydroxybutyrate--acetyl-CoA CoA transferase [Bacillota bacterium]
MANVELMYKEKLRTPIEIAKSIPPGTEMFTDSGLSQPREIGFAMKEAAKEGAISGITVHTILDLYPAPWYDQECADRIHGVSWFSGGNARASVRRNQADIMPCRYAEMAELLALNPQIDCLCIAVSPMDQDGYFTSGLTSALSGDFIKTNAKTIILEVNKKMPRSVTGNKIHISQVDMFCECDYDLPVQGDTEIDEISKTIGALIAEETPNGATLQLGIGAIPESVGLALKNHKDLGIHTELFTDSMIELLECGAVTNELKPIHKGKTVATFAFGSKRLYDYIADNPLVELLPVNYVNNPEVIAQHPNFLSVNSAIEVDFFGQVCAESVGTKHVSGSGGQWEYVRGTTRSKGGKSFIAFSSTAGDGKISRIMPTLTPGAQITTGKNDVDHIVTEYGIAKLRGKTLSQRTKELIRIAHPDFRDMLTFEAKKLGILI